MKRRNFIQKGALTGSLFTLGGAALAAELVKHRALLKTENKNHFNLKYAPHIGMFKESAGPGVLDQLNFMADQGFTAFEDNEMRNRPVAMQEKIAQLMQKRGLQMGVFVAHKIYWSQPNLASGEPAWRDEFLSEITA
ncbi:MAG: xylose isomerase, partial [Marinirhabdus sp.]